jgi:hypothetical protein
VKGCSCFHIFQIRKIGKRNQGALATVTINGAFDACGPQYSSLIMINTLVKRMEEKIMVGILIQSFPFINA